MAILKKTFFFSDVHLSPMDEKATVRLSVFLEFCKAQAETIYILGDLFDYWIGDDWLTEFHQKIIKQLRSLTDNGMPIFFVAGNRDFLIGKSFLQQTGLRPLAEEQLITLYGQKILLMHGDTLCTNDLQYQRFRKYSRNPSLNRFFLKLPLSLRLNFGKFMRKKSRAYTQTTSLEKMDVVERTVRERMQMVGATILIHGHTHKPGIESYQEKETVLTRYTLGAWHEDPYILIADQFHGLQLIKLQEALKLFAAEV